MARLVTSGFETGSLNSEGEGIGVSAGTPTISSSANRTGGFGFRAGGNLTALNWTVTMVTQRNYYERFYFRKSANPGVTVIVSQLFAGASQIANIQLNSSGQLVLSDAGGAVFTSSALTDAVWYRIGTRFRVGTTTGNGELELTITGASVYSSNARNLGTAAPTQIILGRSNADLAGAVNLDYDDVALNDDQGSDQNSWPGQGAIRHLHGASNNANGNWTKPGGATTNMSTAIDNRPPVGIADSTSAANAEKMVRNPSTGANNDLVVNADTYTAAGIGADETVMLVEGIANVASSSTTDTAGELQIGTNPAGTTFSFAAYDVSNAIAGTYPTGWNAIRTVPTYAPSVTKGNAPTIRIRKVTNTNRVVLVDYAAIVVETAPIYERQSVVAVASGIATAGVVVHVFQRQSVVAETTTIAAAGQRDLLRSSATSVTTGISTSGVVIPGLTEYERSAAVSTALSISSSATFWTEFSRSSDVAVTTGISARGEIVKDRTSTVAVQTSIQAGVQRELNRQAGVAIQADIISGGVEIIARSASVSISTGISATPQRDVQRSAALSLATSVEALYRRERLRQAALNVATSISSAGETERAIVTYERAAALGVTTSISSSAIRWSVLERTAGVGVALGVEATGSVGVLHLASALVHLALALSSSAESERGNHWQSDPEGDWQATPGERWDPESDDLWDSNNEERWPIRL